MVDDTQIEKQSQYKMCKEDFAYLAPQPHAL